LSRKRNKIIFGACAVIGLALAPLSVAASAEQQLLFNRDIRPILADTCFKCHGFDAKTRKANLRLDLPAEAFKLRKHGTPIVPGHADASEAYRRLTSTDPDVAMPPPDSHLKLTAPQIQIIRRWIDEGARYQVHWAFIAPVDPPPPQVSDSRWPRNPIDNFVLARLEQEGLQPSSEADRRTLIRRVSLDLTGLPPTPTEIDNFLDDHSATAYETVVDRLLASPRYGERMAVEWLDAARYADSNGYQADPTRTMWPWRDWIIDALNANMPFDEFTVDQIAGDLLPNATAKQRLASGFNRNHSYNGEGGRISEETRADNVLDRVDTTATTFLGLTAGCAKCHDHKYDPITQKEYYQLYAYFNQCSESGAIPSGSGNAPPVMDYLTPRQEQRLAALRTNERDAKAKLAAALPEIDAAQSQWENSVDPREYWTIANPAKLVSRNGATMQRLGDGSILVGGPSPETDVQEVTIATDLTGVSGLRLEALPDPTLPHGGPGRSEDTGNFVLTSLEAEAISRADPKQTRKIKFSFADATYSQQGFSVAAAISGNPTNGWAVDHAPDKHDISATFTFAQPVGFESGTELHLRFHYESKTNKRHTMGHFRLALTSGPVLTRSVAAALAVAPQKRTGEQKKQIAEFYRMRISNQFRSLSAAVVTATRAVDNYEKSLTKVMVMDDATPRQTHVLLRGQYDKPGDKVEPGVPAFLPALPPGAPHNRLALARWIVDPANPLTARVIVNRYWQSFFGSGIVKTAEDFGTQGEPPSHPELLDWLASRFVANGWNVKAIQRLIVTSSTYRQSSKISAEMLERDPANRLLARGPRFRLSSFVLRDQALAASGLLVEKLGGPPVKPYQPPGVWEEMSLGQIRYVQDHGDSLYRRSIYTFWRRTVAPTTMFDVSPRMVCMVRPLRTNTPLQALALLNDVTYIEAARVLSESLLEDASSMTGQKLDQIFVRLMARPCRTDEREILLAALDRLRSQFGSDKAAALKLVSAGEKPRSSNIDPPELAAWTALVNTVMNMDEAITKE